MTKIIVILSIFFTTLVLQGQQAPCACCSQSHTEFDFWLGEWDVTTANNQPAGKNSIIKLQDNCVIQERWVSATPGYTGTSYNFFNQQTKEWEQIWVDNQGASLHMKGKKIGNQMILRTADQKNAKGQSFFHRITWTANENGTVRQLWETITNGDQVTVAFDGLYKKRNTD